MLRSYDIVVYDTPVPWHRAGLRNGVAFKKKVDVNAQFLIRAAWMQEHGHLGPLEGPLRMALTAFLPYPPSRSKKSRLGVPLPTGVPDVDNLVKQAKDALSRYAFTDDRQIVTLLARKRYALTEEGEDTPPRWVITLEQIYEGGQDEASWGGIYLSDEPDRHRRA